MLNLCMGLMIAITIQCNNNMHIEIYHDLNTNNNDNINIELIKFFLIIFRKPFFPAHERDFSSTRTGLNILESKKSKTL